MSFAGIPKDLKEIEKDFSCAPKQEKMKRGEGIFVFKFDSNSFSCFLVSDILKKFPSASGSVCASGDLSGRGVYYV